jgi:hypothetical protein
MYTGAVDPTAKRSAKNVEATPTRGKDSAV